MSAYYNEIDPYAAQWLRNLIAAGHIAPGDVDERSIEDVQPDDVRGYTQCHFFAGIGGWSYALRLTGWPDDRPVWTGSCPCQPFSSAGKGAGFADSRHLWPTWFRLIGECAPSVIFGEQVASAAGWAWFDTVSTDLEGAAYAVGAADVPAAGVGAFHIRQRMWWVANATRARLQRRRHGPPHQGRAGASDQFAGAGDVGVLADAERGAAERRRHNVAGAARGTESEARQRERVRAESGASGTVGIVAHTYSQSGESRHGRCGKCRIGANRKLLNEFGGGGSLGELGNACGAGLQGRTDQELRRTGRGQEGRGAASASVWDAVEWLPCRDGKARPTEPGLFPLAHGVSGRVGRLRAYGNAIVPACAAEFVKAYREAIGEDLHGV